VAETPARIGVLCAYVPRELITAAGFETRVVTGLEACGDAEVLPANLCPHVRRAAAYLSGPGAEDLAGVVVADSCFPMLRLWDHLEASGSTIPRWLLHVPRCDTPLAARYFRDELERLAAGLAVAAGLPGLSGERIETAVAARNRHREQCRRAAAGLIEGTIPGVTPHLLGLFAGCEEMAADAVPDAPVKTAVARRRPRVMLVGSYFVTAELVELVSGMGADVCAVESCTHYRIGTPPVAFAAGGDPFLALAEAYLAQPPCPRMQSGCERADAAGRLAASGAVDGVVYLLMKSCTPHAYAVPLWRERLGRAGTPLLVLEVEDDDWSQPRLATRLEAFVEALAGRAAP
jgi:benzoyl-CoA reductase/2-hydroxyglutaryl-CoA dehydratase subunit BcrC/BadD/HgdB